MEPSRKFACNGASIEPSVGNWRLFVEWREVQQLFTKQGMEEVGDRSPWGLPRSKEKYVLSSTGQYKLYLGMDIARDLRSKETSITKTSASPKSLVPPESKDSVPL